MERRNLIGGGFAAGMAAMVAPAEAAAAQRDGDDTTVARAVDGVRNAIDNLQAAGWQRIGQIRDQQRMWLRANHKYPEFIEIGIGIWEALYDWHVRYQQPISMTRLADGRYVMSFMFTTFILRPDQDFNYVGPAFDGDVRRP